MWLSLALAAFCTLIFCLPVQGARQPIPSWTVTLRVGHHHATFVIRSFNSQQGFRALAAYSSSGETCARAEQRANAVYAVQASYYYLPCKGGDPLPLDYIRQDGRHLVGYRKDKGRPLIALSDLGVRLILKYNGEEPTESENPVWAIDHSFRDTFPQPLRRMFMCIPQGIIRVGSDGRLHRKNHQILWIVYSPAATEADYEAFKWHFRLDDHRIATFDGDTSCNPRTRANTHITFVQGGSVF